MYNAQRKISLDSAFGGILVASAIVWTGMTLALAPIDSVPASGATLAQANDTPLMVYAAPGAEHLTGEVMTFPSNGMEVIVDKKYA